jgi:hypothetical protein
MDFKDMNFAEYDNWNGHTAMISTNNRSRNENVIKI